MLVDKLPRRLSTWTRQGSSESLVYGGNGTPDLILDCWVMPEHTAVVLCPQAALDEAR
jgi:hypothetical protein